MVIVADPPYDAVTVRELLFVAGVKVTPQLRELLPPVAGRAQVVDEKLPAAGLAVKVTVPWGAVAVPPGWVSVTLAVQTLP